MNISIMLEYEFQLQLSFLLLAHPISNETSFSEAADG